MSYCRFSIAVCVCVVGCLSVQQSQADLVQYWPLDDGATNAASATAANLAAGGNIGMLSAGGVPESWVTTGLHPQLASREANPSLGAMRLDTSFFDFMDGGDLGLNSTPSGGQATVSMWINPVSLASELEGSVDGDRLINQIGPTECCNVGVGGGIRINDDNGLYAPTNGLQVFPNTSAAWSTFTEPSNAITKDTWQHLAFVWNYGQVTAYINGNDIGTRLSNFSYDSAGSGTNQNFGLGARFQDINSNFSGRGFDGLVDDVAVWSTALPADRIASLASGSSPLSIAEDPLPAPGPYELPPAPAATLVQYWPFDDGASDPTSGTAANLVAGGNQGLLSAGGLASSWTTSGLHGPLTTRAANPSTAAVRLNSETFDLVDAGDLGLESTEFGGSASLSMWIYSESLGQDGGDRLFTQIGPTDCCDSGVGGSTQIIPSSEGYALQMWPNNGGDWQTLAEGDSPENALVNNEWQHLAFVWNHDQVTMYLNGIETGTVQSNFAYDSAGTGTNQNFGLGARFNNAFGSSYDGLVDDLTVWEGALTPQQVAALASGASPLSLDTSLSADFDGDGDVDGRDFLIWQSGYGNYSGNATSDVGDANGDGFVDDLDLSAWQQEYATVEGLAAASTAVPEPATLTSVFLAGLAWMYRRSSRRKRG